MEGGTEERCRRREIKRTGGRGWRDGGMEGVTDVGRGRDPVMLWVKVTCISAPLYPS